MNRYQQVIPEGVAPVDAHFVRVVDDRLQCTEGNNVTYVLKEAAQTVNFTPLRATSYSDTSINFTINNIGEKCCRDPRLGFGCNITGTFNVTNTNVSGPPLPLFTSDNIGIKSWAANRNWGINHQIGGATENLNTYDIIDLLSKLNITPELDGAFWDQIAPDLIADFAASTGSNLNPCQNYSSTIPGHGVFKYRSINFTQYSTYGGVTYVGSSSVPANTTAIVTAVWTIYEPLISPFLNISPKNSRGLYDVQGEIITLSVQPNIFNNTFLFAPPVGFTINSTSASFQQSQNLVAPNAPIAPYLAPTLYQIILTPPANLARHLPENAVYEYNKFLIQTTSASASSLAPGGSVNVNSQVAEFPTIPVWVANYVRVMNNYRDSTMTDKYLNLISLSAQLDNQNQQFQACTPDQLFDISYSNSLRSIPRVCWKQGLLNQNAQVNGNMYGCGSIFLCSPSNLNLRAGLCEATAGVFPYQIQNAIFQNSTATAFPPTLLYTVSCHKALLVKTGKLYQNRMLYIKEGTINHIQNMRPVMLEQYQDAINSNAFLGGSFKSFFSDVWDGIKKVGKYAWNHKDQILDVAKTVAPLVGLGAKKRRSVHKRRASHKKMSGGNYSDDEVDLFYE